IGAGLLGGGALGNLLSPSSQTDPTAADPAAAGILNTTPLFSATYGVNPDGSLTTLSPPTLVSPGDGSITPPQPFTLSPVDTIPASPPTPAPVDTAPASPPPPPAPVDVAPASPPPPP